MWHKPINWKKCAIKHESKKKKGHKDVQTNHCFAKRPENASKTLTYPAYRGCFLVSFFKRFHLLLWGWLFHWWTCFQSVTSVCCDSVSSLSALVGSSALYIKKPKVPKASTMTLKYKLLKSGVFCWKPLVMSEGGGLRLDYYNFFFFFCLWAL